MFWKSPAVKAMLIILIIIIVVAGIVLLAFMEEIIIRNQPVQNMHVEVVGKRTKKSYHSTQGIRYENKIPTYIVAFKFPDETEKELKIKSTIYNDLQENETGMLSFQEHKNITKWEDSDRWAHRYFISFEKDE